MAYTSAVQSFIDHNFETYQEGKCWVKKLSRSVFVPKTDQKIQLLKSIIHEVHSKDPVNNPPKSLKEILVEYLHSRKNAPVEIHVNQGVKVACPRLLFRREIRKELKRNNTLSILTTPEDLRTAQKIYFGECAIDFEYFKRNYQWLTSITTLSKKLYDVWVDHIEECCSDMKMTKHCLDSFLKDKVITPAGLMLVKKSLKIVKTVRIIVSFNEELEVIVGSLGKRQTRSLKKCLALFNDVDLTINNRFQYLPCIRFHNLLKSLISNSNLKSLAIPLPCRNNQDKNALLDFIKTVPKFETLIISVLGYNDAEIQSLIIALDNSKIENFHSDVIESIVISDKCKRSLIIRDKSFIEYFTRILSGLSREFPEIDLFYTDFMNLPEHKKRQGMEIFWEFFDLYVTGEMLGRSKEALEVYRKLLSEYPVLIKPFKVYFLDIPRIVTIRERDLSSKDNYATAVYAYPHHGEPVILDQKLAETVSKYWVNGGLAVKLLQKESTLKFIEFAKTGWIEFKDIYEANKFHRIAGRYLMYSIREAAEKYIVDELKKYKSLLLLSIAFTDYLKLQNKIFAYLIHQEIALKITRVYLKVALDQHGKVFVSLQSFDKKIIRHLHKMQSFGVLKGFSIASLDKMGWKKLKGFLIHYPNEDLDIQVPFNAFRSGFDKRRFPKRHLDKIYEPYSLQYTKMLANSIGYSASLTAPFLDNRKSSSN